MFEKISGRRKEKLVKKIYSNFKDMLPYAKKLRESGINKDLRSITLRFLFDHSCCNIFSERYLKNSDDLAVTIINSSKLDPISEEYIYNIVGLSPDFRDLTL